MLYRISSQSMNREDVYKELDKERDYQDYSASGWENKGVPTVGEELLIVEHYVQLAREAWVTKMGSHRCLCEMRKITATLIRCFEHHGVPERIASVDAEGIVRG